MYKLRTVNVGHKGCIGCFFRVAPGFCALNLLEELEKTKLNVDCYNEKGNYIYKVVQVLEEEE